MFLSSQMEILNHAFRVSRLLVDTHLSHYLHSSIISLDLIIIDHWIHPEARGKTIIVLFPDNVNFNMYLICFTTQGIICTSRRLPLENLEKKQNFLSQFQITGFHRVSHFTIICMERRLELSMSTVAITKFSRCQEIKERTG